MGEIPAVKIWVTGAAGSLGTALINSLSLTYQDIEILAPRHNELDLENGMDVLAFVQKQKPTHVFHLAAKVFGISGHIENPEGSLLTNSRIDNSFFSALIDQPPEWVYYASTVAAYGYPFTSMPLKEEDWLNGAPHHSEYGYAMAKRHAISYLQVLNEKSGTKFSYGLTTNLFGIGDRFLEGRGHVIISLLEKAMLAKKNRSKLEVWGSGAATRDFLSTDDASALIINLIDKHVGIVNIASGQEITISSIAAEIVREFELEKSYEFVGFNEGITNRVCSIAKLSEYAPIVNSIDSFKKIKQEINMFKLRS